jgi:hypothetical protein
MPTSLQAANAGAGMCWNCEDNSVHTVDSIAGFLRCSAIKDCQCKVICSDNAIHLLQSFMRSMAVAIAE